MKKFAILLMLGLFNLGCVNASAATYISGSAAPGASSTGGSTYTVSPNGPGNSNGYTNSNSSNSPVVFSYPAYNNGNYAGFNPMNNSTTTLPATPAAISNASVTPENTNYGDNSAVKYDLFIGSVKGSSNERGDTLTCIKKLNLASVGINNTLGEMLSIYTDSYGNLSGAFSKDTSSNDRYYFNGTNFTITFDVYKASYGIDIYASVAMKNGAYSYSLTDSQIGSFLNQIQYQYNLKLQQEEATKNNELSNSNTSNQSSQGNYNNSVIINGNNSGSIVVNNYK